MAFSVFPFDTNHQGDSGMKKTKMVAVTGSHIESRRSPIGPARSVSAGGIQDQGSSERPHGVCQGQETSD